MVSADTVVRTLACAAGLAVTMAARVYVAARAASKERASTPPCTPDALSGLAVSAVVWIAPNGRATALLLGVAVAAQIADVVAAVANRLTGMAVGAASAALLHAAALAIAL